MRMLMQLVTTPLDLTRDSRVYSPFCRDWAFIQSMSSHGCSFARNHHTGDTFTQRNKMCFKCGGLGHSRSDCPRNRGAISGQSGYVPGVCPRCRKGNHWARDFISKLDIQGHPVSGNRQRPPHTHNKQLMKP